MGFINVSRILELYYNLNNITLEPTTVGDWAMFCTLSFNNAQSRFQRSRNFLHFSLKKNKVQNTFLNTLLYHRCAKNEKSTCQNFVFEWVQRLVVRKMIFFISGFMIFLLKWKKLQKLRSKSVIWVKLNPDKILESALFIQKDPL